VTDVVIEFIIGLDAANGMLDVIDSTLIDDVGSCEWVIKILNKSDELGVDEMVVD
jgi:hypothetical protein